MITTCGGLLCFFPVPSIFVLYFFLDMLVWLFHLVHELMVLLSEGIEVCFALLLVSVCSFRSGSCSCQNFHPFSHCVGHISICDSRLLTSMNMQFKVKFGLPLISANGKVIMNVETEREWMSGYDFLKELASNRVNLNLEY